MYFRFFPGQWFSSDPSRFSLSRLSCYRVLTRLIFFFSRNKILLKNFSGFFLQRTFCPSTKSRISCSSSWRAKFFCFKKKNIRRVFLFCFYVSCFYFVVLSKCVLIFRSGCPKRTGQSSCRVEKNFLLTHKRLEWRRLWEIEPFAGLMENRLWRMRHKWARARRRKKEGTVLYNE